MIKNIATFCVILYCIFGFEKTSATEVYPFFLQRHDGSVLEGYFSPPSTNSSPIIFAIQGSTCESALKWHMELSDQASAFGFGLIVLEKQGISKNGINILEYSMTNCLQNRLNDYSSCIENMHLISPEWNGKAVFWGESEGGMLAANLASQVPQTAAVLLFATGGGMKPREEVNWALHHRLEEHGASQSEIDQYMNFFDDQMEAMVLDPSPEKHFLGNTYKWWASLLAADEALMPLNQHSFPIYFVHGVQDSQIPILSADIAAESLKETNALTYLRLEGYDHDLDTANIHAAACRWLNSVLLGQEQSNDNLVATSAQPETSSSEDWKTDISHYVLYRGRGEASAEAKCNRATHGNERASGSVNISKKMDCGVKLETIPVTRRGGDNDDKGGSYGGARVDIEFGPGGPEWSASAYGGYEDERGNYVEVEVRRNEDGRTTASAETGHDK